MPTNPTTEVKPDQVERLAHHMGRRDAEAGRPCMTGDLHGVVADPESVAAAYVRGYEADR